MRSVESESSAREPLLTMTGLRIEGQADDEWHEIVHGVDVVLHRGEVLGLIGESGAGKSTIGLAAMGFARPGCRLTGGDIVFDGVELRGASRDHTRALRGARIAYVAQSAAAAFNPAHRLIDQFTEAPVRHKVKSRSAAEADAKDLYGRLRPPGAREDRLSLSAPGLGRAASARHGRHGHGVPSPTSSSSTSRPRRSTSPHRSRCWRRSRTS